MASSNSPKTSTSSLFGELPRGKWWGDNYLHNWEGFWYGLPHLEGAMAARLHFEACSDDVILASSMKTGSTWLKALIPTIMKPNARAIDDGDENDPLTTNHPNALIPSLEIQIFKENSNPHLSGMPSPRLFRTHVPYTMLSESIKNSGCKIVYITRDPKDTFVSLWHFINTKLKTPEQVPFSINEAFERFCNGIHPFGPFHDHVLEYWKESLKRPEKILFLKYEEMKREPREQVKKLASFLGRPFVKEEEEVDKVLWRCSFERLKNLEVNKNGVDPCAGFAYSSYFRLGSVGDWKNSLSMEMKERLDQITCMKLDGSGLDLGIL